VRFWGETPLVREPDVTLFGITRLDPPEQEFLSKSPLRHITAEQIAAKGAAAAATEALTHLHADTREFVMHLDLDVITQEDFPPVNVPASGGMRLEDVRGALKQFAAHKNLLGLDIAQYNPDKDPDGSHAKQIVDLIVEVLSARLGSLAIPGSLAPAESTAPEPAGAGSVKEANNIVDGETPAIDAGEHEPAQLGSGEPGSFEL
jgi:arginase family enzyme